jgi:hypothetical protein
LPVNNFAAMLKLRGARCWRALTAGIENVGQPQTRQNNPTILEMPHRDVEA